MKTKKGYMLAEVLVAMAIIAAIAAPISKFTRQLLADIPKSLRHIEVNTSLMNLVYLIKDDVAAAHKISADAEDMLTLQAGDKAITYRFGQDGISRKMSGDDCLPKEWAMRGGRIAYEVVQINDVAAVKLTKYIEVKTYRGVEKKMKETYLCFPMSEGRK